MKKEEFKAILDNVQALAAAKAELSPHETAILLLASRYNPANHYCQFDRVRRVSELKAGPLTISAYTVADPATLEHGPVQFHMTWGGNVMALMSEDGAKLFARVVAQTLGLSFDYAANDSKETVQPTGGSNVTENNSNE